MTDPVTKSLLLDIKIRGSTLAFVSSQKLEEDLAAGKIEEHAWLTSHFAKAVRIAADRGVNIGSQGFVGAPDGESFEQGLERLVEKTDQLCEDITSVVLRNLKLEGKVDPTIQKQHCELEDARLDLIDSVYAYRASQERRMERDSHRYDNAIRINPRR